MESFLSLCCKFLEVSRSKLFTREVNILSIIGGARLFIILKFCGANQWTGFFMISASVMKGLRFEDSSASL